GEADCGGHYSEQGRVPLREGGRLQAGTARHRAGVDEPDELRENADLPRVRNRETRGGALWCGRARKRDRRTGPVRSAECGGGILPADRRIQTRPGVGEQTANSQLSSLKSQVSSLKCERSALRVER